MADWKQYENEPTEDLIEIIKWKNQEGYKEEAEAAFKAFCFRFDDDVVKKCEIICKNRGHDSAIAAYISNKTFEKFWKNPDKFDFNKKKTAKDFNTAVKFYLYGIAYNELINYYREQNGINVTPYSGDEEIIWDFDQYQESFEPEKIKELKETFEVIKLALDRLTEKHRIIYLTYLYHRKEGHNLPTHLYEALRDALGIAQGTIRYYHKQARDKVGDIISLYGKK